MKLLNINDPVLQKLMQRMDHIENSIGALITKNLRQKWYSEKELMQILKVSRDTLRKYRNSGELPYHRTGRKYLYSQDAIDQFMAAKQWDQFA